MFWYSLAKAENKPYSYRSNLFTSKIQISWRLWNAIQCLCQLYYCYRISPFFFNADSNNILLHTSSSSIYFCKFQLHMWASFSDPCVSHELWLFISWLLCCRLLLETLHLVLLIPRKKFLTFFHLPTLPFGYTSWWWLGLTTYSDLF